MRTLLIKCLKDESGNELIEYALLLGLIVVGCLGIMGALGVKVFSRWQDIADQM